MPSQNATKDNNSPEDEDGSTTEKGGAEDHGRDDQKKEQDPAAPKEGKTNKDKNQRSNKHKSPSSPLQACLKDKIDIFHDRPIPVCNLGDIRAYQAIAKGRDDPLVAMVCDPSLVPRSSKADVYGNFTNPAMISLIDHGVIFWPPVNEERCVFVYRNNAKQRLLEEKNKQAAGLKQEAVLDKVIKPLISVLEDLTNKDFVHGAIRPDNMFSSSGNNKIEHVFLGDCLSSPEGYSQPVLYQTLARAMTDPSARGPGTLSDDLYAFGVSIAVLLRSQDPLEGMSDDEIIRHKIQFGSYSALTGKEKFKGHILELLRGLLQDDCDQRWTMEEILGWLDGRRLSPKQSVRDKKAPRPLIMGKKKYFFLKFLAMDLDLNPQETMKAIEQEDLQQWLERSLEDTETLERVEKVITQSTGGGGTKGESEHRLISNLSIAIDPLAPVRYKGMRLMADGFGKAMAKAYILGQDIKPFIEMISNNIVLNWVKAQHSNKIDTGALIGRFENCRKYIGQTRFGFGVEKAMYLLCPELQCLSDHFKKYYVNGPEKMILAFEDLCQKGQSSFPFIDRHCAAFLSLKDARLIDPFLFDMGSTKEHKRALAQLKCLARIQKLGNIGPLPGIASVFLKNIDSVYERYHDIQTREKVQKNVEKHAKAGSLVKMINVLDNVELHTRDYRAFRIAMHEYSQLSQEEDALTARLEDRQTFARKKAQEISALIACVVSLFIILLTALFTLSQSAPF